MLDKRSLKSSNYEIVTATQNSELTGGLTEIIKHHLEYWHHHQSCPFSEELEIGLSQAHKTKIKNWV